MIRAILCPKNVIRGKNFAGCVINILKLQYDDYPKLSCGTDIEADLNQIYSELHKLLDTNAKIEKAIQSLTNRKWHFTCEKDRPIVAAEILGLNPSNGEKLPPSFELFYNFRCNGFGLFYFVLKDLKGLHFNKTEEATELLKKKGYSAGDNPYYNELYKIYLKNITEKKSKKIWNAQLIKICRQYLREIFDGDMYEALKYYWSQRSNDSDRKFLWEVFNEQEILPHIITPQTQN